MIYNLPAQTDVAEIVARIEEAPLLSIKLMPTMYMKGRKADGTIGVLTTITAMVIFAVDTSAEQFVFDASMEPLIIRGCTAVVKLLNSPTYPFGASGTAYATAPARLISRRIRFHQPGLISAEEFDDVLAGNSHGFRQPGWIVDKTMKKEAGRNMVTLEFASVEVARFAWQQFGWLPDFRGCEPCWVYEHEINGKGKGRRGPLRTRDGEDSDAGEGAGEANEWKPAALGDDAGVGGFEACEADRGI
jgi:hypothetical protein